MQLEQILKDIDSSCKTNTEYKKRLNDLYNFMITQYPFIDELLLKYFNEESIEKLIKDSDMQLSILNCIENILSQKDYTFSLEAFEQNNKIISLFELIYKYIIKNISFNEVKYSIYLFVSRINFEHFTNLSKSSVLALCKLNNRNVDLKFLYDKGNCYITIVNDIADGLYKDTSYVKPVSIIAQTIDECMKTGDDMELSFEDGSLIFEKPENDTVFIYDDFESDPVAIINSENEFLTGNFDILLKKCSNFDIERLVNSEIDLLINEFNG